MAARPPVSFGPAAGLARCLACGARIQSGLASLGSLRCADCRSDRRPLDPAHVQALTEPSSSQPRRA